MVTAKRPTRKRNELHRDFSCGNLLLDRHLNLKLGDLPGSSIDQSKVLSYYGTDYLLPQDNFAVAIKTEIFVFGSTLFHIVSGSRSYDSLAID
jgi:serine/threonine protein kinase